MNQHRAYSQLELKQVDEEKRIITGIATTPSTDRMDDVVEPMGAVFNLPIPFLWQHECDEPIGFVTKATLRNSGVEVEIQVANIAEDGKLKDTIDKAWQYIKYKLVRGLSIGFRGLETAQIEGTWGIRYIKWEWLELSAVTIPANADASIQSIKRIDDAIIRSKSKGIKLVQPRAVKSGAVALVNVGK